MGRKIGDGMNTFSIKSFFSADHDRLDKLFQEWQSKKHEDFPSAKNSFREFFFGLKRHIEWEEKVLFPAFEGKTGFGGQGPTAVMRYEHKEIKRILEAIHEYVRNADPNTGALEEELLSVLGGHNGKEENILYPAIDNVTDESERQKMFAEIHKISTADTQTCCGLSAE